MQLIVVLKPVGVIVNGVRYVIPIGRGGGCGGVHFYVLLLFVVNSAESLPRAVF
jgi:hypothetical protein